MFLFFLVKRNNCLIIPKQFNPRSCNRQYLSSLQQTKIHPIKPFPENPNAIPSRKIPDENLQSSGQLSDNTPFPVKSKDISTNFPAECTARTFTRINSDSRALAKSNLQGKTPR
ncbi:hypothetical protein AVEN_42228-1 [Araneus ventricosus]|uniref:Uncharacterized protein n=1 Tax=Araneus ventricosus TaxID=182803 RepID=A0A4Y2AZG3_ARAVE|nr:hypothetical protein AVEN_42228-1 [Araneus ventricosus]